MFLNSDFFGHWLLHSTLTLEQAKEKENIFSITVSSFKSTLVAQ